MDKELILQTLYYTLPSLVSGLIAWYFFKEYARSDSRLEKFKLLQEEKKHTTNLKLQAYERLTLFLERISLTKLVTRISAKNDNKQAYAMSLIHTIEQEFKHNITQQIYISEEAWNIVVSAKNRSIQIIRELDKDTTVKDASELREQVIKKIMKSQNPSETALLFLKQEVKKIL